ncbi:MAG: 1-(5-phosphoribosyl)-5-[(5-phosphoribosylamino)methylideneamino]imidazole-4-carboxamide isomerase [Chloroflexi bacterium]|nr:1-(5-phosphoribosyl)-5-[(5-phosphoribosylamino)methylideneamino]imidazole-4-carboxamide isomerase [Chloroflexota bacterium]
MDSIAGNPHPGPPPFEKAPSRGGEGFIVFPAIDLRGGKVVRLAQGDLARATVYGNDPAATAQRWNDAGAGWIHVVNLDGAFGESAEANWKALESVVRVGKRTRIQFGGGLRTLETIRHAIEIGITRVVIGTAAVETPKLVDDALAEFGPERIAVGVDAREGRVRVKGWAEESSVTAMELAQRLKGQGVKTIVFTDVARDGIGVGVNVSATAELAQRSGLSVIASGGVAGIDDVRRAREAELAGVIIGRALYEGKIDLAEALREQIMPQV